MSFSFILRALIPSQASDFIFRSAIFLIGFLTFGVHVPCTASVFFFFMTRRVSESNSTVYGGFSGIGNLQVVWDMFVFIKTLIVVC